MACQVNRNPETKQIEKVLAPNGKDSILFNELNKAIKDKEKSLRAWAKVYTPSFKAWFGDWQNDPQNSSKVVDENGEPLLVYHGTTASFEVFDKSFSKEEGFHFGSRRAAIQRMFDGMDELGIDEEDALKDLEEEYDYKLMPSFLNIKNAIEGIDYLHAEHLDNISQEEYDALYKLGEGKTDEMRKLVIAFYGKGVITQPQAEAVLKGESTLQQELGTDGYFYTNKLEDKGATSWVVFEPENIKSATAEGGLESRKTSFFESEVVIQPEGLPAIQPQCK